MTSTESKAALVKDYVSDRLVTIDSDPSALEIANRMLEKHVSAVIVEDSGKPVGILTERDLTRQVIAKDCPPSKTPATVIMSTPLISIEQKSPIERAAEAMAKNGIRHLAVEDRGKLIGMITTTDLSRYVKEELLAEERISHSVLEVLYPSEEPSEENRSYPCCLVHCTAFLDYKYDEIHCCTCHNPAHGERLDMTNAKYTRTGRTQQNFLPRS
jgi:CBS domain-containing protein